MTRLVASPYLDDVPFAIVRPLLEQLPDPELRAHLTASVPHLRAIADALNERVVVVTERERAALLSIRALGGIDAAAGDSAVAGWAEAELLLPESGAHRRHNYKNIEIEINRHCNFACSFCPVKDEPKPRALMSDSVFEVVLARVQEYGARSISLNHYSEPTLDPKLVERVRRAAARGIGVRLHTNASLLDEQKISALRAAGNLQVVMVNLPTVDPEEYRKVTGAKLYDRVIRNLRLLHAAGLPVRLSINSPRASGDGDLDRINEMFATMFGRSVRWPTDSRAGRLREVGTYGEPLRHPGRLDGCLAAMRQLNVTWEGKAFLCCQDYDQEYVLGDLLTQSIDEIGSGDRAAEIRRWLFGAELPPPGLLCSSCSMTSPLVEDTLRVGPPEDVPTGSAPTTPGDPDEMEWVTRRIILSEGCQA